jgi:hypothetical protein
MRRSVWQRCCKEHPADEGLQTGMSTAREPTATQYAARRRAERRSYGGVLALALGISAVFHVITFRTISFELRLDTQAVHAPPPRMIDMTPAMQAYDLIPVPVQVAPIEVQVRERLLLRETERAELQAPAAELPGMRPPAERLPSASVRERLRYRMGSAQDVWRPPPPAEPGELSPEERVHNRVASRLQEYNDSLAAETAARERALDWTVADAEGKRWGVSPGQIHLGDVTLPLPFAFAPPPGRREEIAGRIRTFEEIQYQAAQVETRQVIDDRARAMRERIDRERRARMSADSAGTSGS